LGESVQCVVEAERGGEKIKEENVGAEYHDCRRCGLLDAPYEGRIFLYRQHRSVLIASLARFHPLH
jgi:hypothetical protein